MRNGLLAAALVLASLPLEARAANSVGWVEPDRQRIAIAGNSAPEPRQVRFIDSWETADYVAFRWRKLQGELVYVTANRGRVAIDFPLTAGEIPRLFHAGQAGAVTLGSSGNGNFLLGTAFGQRFIEGSPLQCFSFRSGDGGQSGSESGLPRRIVYGYACSDGETGRADIDRFMRDIRFVGSAFIADELVAAMEETDEEGARQFALGRTGDVSAIRGLVDLPLGYAVWNPVGGS